MLGKFCFEDSRSKFCDSHFNTMKHFLAFLSGLNESRSQGTKAASLSKGIAMRNLCRRAEYG